MRICVFGDSIAKGVVYDDLKGKYVFSRHSFLDIISQETGAIIKNYARFGCTTEKGELIIDKHLDEVSDYDYTLLEFGGNDCDLDWNHASENPDVPQTGQVSREAFVQNYVRIIEKIKKHDGTPILLNLPPLDQEKFFSWVSRGLNKYNIISFLKHDKSNIYRWQKDYSDLIFKVGMMTDTPVIDIRQAFLESESYGEMLCIDGMHPNEQGHREMASFLEDEWLGLEIE